MAQWTNIPTDRIEPGKPIRAIDGLALRDNPIAIAEGASGAPRVQRAGIQDSAINASKIASNAVTTAKVNNRAITEAKLATGSAERNWVLARTAGASAGAVGTYAFVTKASTSGGIYSWDSTVPGSRIVPASIIDSALGSTSFLSGTWRVMGRQIDVKVGAVEQEATLALRIS